MIPFINKQPAAVAEAVRQVLFVLVLLGVVVLEDQALAAIAMAVSAVLSLFVYTASTSTAAPNLAAGSEVTVKGTSDTVVIQPSPPGPVGVEGGADGAG